MLELENTQVIEGANVAEDAFWGRRPSVSETHIAEAANLMGAAFLGSRRKMLDLAEAITTSDLFQSAAGVVLDREATARYEELAPIWPQFAARTTVRNFKPKKFTDLFGGRSILDPVPEATNYPARNVSADEHEIAVAKRGGRFHITFEDIINDDLDQLRDLPADLAQGARDTEDYLAASQLVTAAGVNTAFFKTANGTAVDNKPLTSENLDAALTAIGVRKSKDGRLFVNGASILVVPPGLQTQARRILAAAEIRTTTGSVTTVEANYLKGAVTVVVNPWLSFIDQSATANSTWFLLPAPTAPRKALAVAFLRGHEQPDLRVKKDQGSSVSGGDVAANEGGFDDDTIQYRVRHILGAATLYPEATYASKGA